MERAPGGESLAGGHRRARKAAFARHVVEALPELALCTGTVLDAVNAERA